MNNIDEFNKIFCDEVEWLECENIGMISELIGLSENEFLRNAESSNIIMVDGKYLWADLIDLAHKIASNVNKNKIQNPILEMLFSGSFFSSPIKKLKFNTYLIFDSGNNLYKIGRSSDTLKRFNSISSTNPGVSYLAECVDDVEKELHDKFKDKRIRNEWFSLSIDDVKYIKKRFRKLA